MTHSSLTRRALLTSAFASTVSPAAGNIRITHAEGEKVAFHSGDRLLFEYRYATSRPKPYVHPLCAPNGAPVTLDAPPDHVHHRGVMLAWSDIQGHDFWGETNPGPPHGQIVHQKLERVAGEQLIALNHWVANSEIVLIERRTIRARQHTPEMVWLDWESELRAAGVAVTLSAKDHVYNGLGIRFIDSMAAGEVLNSNGSNTIEPVNGEPASWVVYSGALPSGEVAACGIVDHPANPRHPTPFFVMNKPFGYLSAAPTFREPLIVSPAKPLRLRYAVVTLLGRPNRQMLNKAFDSWARRVS